VHASVKASLARQPEVVELVTEMTPVMKQLQDTVLRMIDACLTQLRATTKVSLRAWSVARVRN
jgi:hypothetical protein